jgi:hypothetical protein
MVIAKAHCTKRMSRGGSALWQSVREECSRDVNELLAALVEHEVLDVAREAATTELTSQLPCNEDDERDLIVDLGVLVR